MTTKQQERARLHRAVEAAEAKYQRSCDACYAQRPIAEAARRADILARAGGINQIPPPRRGDNAPPTKTQIDAARELEKLNQFEFARSSDGAAFVTACAEELDFENAILTAERERLADDDSEAAQLALERLCPDERRVPLNERFTLSPKVQRRLAGIRGIRDDVNTSCETLQLGIDTDYRAECERVLSAA